MALDQVEEQLLELLVALAEARMGIGREKGRASLVEPGRVRVAVGVGGYVEGGVGVDVDQLVAESVDQAGV
jgi:hypothetical protein